MIGVAIITNPALISFFTDVERWKQVFVLYVFCTLIRALVVIMLSGQLQGGPYPFTYKEGLILIWGGLRGAVGLALAIVAQYEYGQAAKEVAEGRWKLDQLLKNDLDHTRNFKRIGDEILFFSAMLVLFTLIVNGTTMSYLITYLRMDAVPTAKLLELRAAYTHVMREGEKKMNLLKKNHYYSGADWKRVRECESTFILLPHELKRKRMLQLKTTPLFLFPFSMARQTCQT